MCLKNKNFLIKAGNFFRSRATLRHYLYLTNRISVKKKANFQLKNCRCGRMWPAGRVLPPTDLDVPTNAIKMSQILATIHPISLEVLYL